jgi:hypothetical protein
VQSLLTRRQIPLRSRLRCFIDDYGATVEIDENPADKWSRQLSHNLAHLTWQSTPPRWPDVAGDREERHGLARLDDLG